MHPTKPSYDSAEYLNVLTPTVSYRKLPSGVKFYFHYHTRADREMLSQLNQRILAVSVFGWLFVPMFWFGFGSPAWPIILGAFLLWLSWIVQMSWQRFFKMKGMEILYVTNRRVELVRCLNWAGRRWNLSRNVLKGKVRFTLLNQSVKRQLFFGIEPSHVIKILHPSPSSSTPEIGLKVSKADFEKILHLIQSI